MDFFGAQDAARVRSRTLVLLFAAAVVAIIIATYVIVHIALRQGVHGPIDFGLLAIVAFGTGLLVAAGSGFRTMQLRQGGTVVAELLGGRRIRPNTTDPNERRLVNVVEEMAIASGTPVPAIYVMDAEEGINAFAAGYTLNDAAVAVTRGTLETLSRDELQGVIAHEFSHILNGDMRLNIRLIGLLYGILLLAVIGRGLLHAGGGGRGRRDGGGQIALVGIGLIVIGYLGVVFGRLIQAAVSRQREYLADAAAVQFTRDPDGIAGALKKIGGLATGSRIRDHHAQEAGHMFFANGLSRSFSSLFATHPPLSDRIKRVDPRFDGKYPPVERRAAPEPEEPRRPEPRRAPPIPIPVLGETLGPALGGVGDAAGAAVGGTGAAGGLLGLLLIESIGAPRAEHIAFARELLASLPAEVRDAAHDPDGAQHLLCALLLHHDDARVMAAQREAIAAHGGAAAVERVAALAAQVQPLGHAARLPLLDLLLPALHELSPAQRHSVRETVERLIRADERVDMFELALYHVLTRQLREPAEHDAAAGEHVHSFAPLRAEVQATLSAVAWSGADDEADALAAFNAAARTLPETVGRLELVAREAVGITSINRALDRLRGATPALRRRFLEACTYAAAHDGRIHTQEAELLRAVAEAMDCPIPAGIVTTPHQAGATAGPGPTT
jgi:Zn-dependent protease with chaperone function